MRHLCILTAALCLALPAFAAPQTPALRPAKPIPAAAAPLLAHSFRRPSRNGWIYVHLQGSPRQLGFQNGYWLAPEIGQSFAAFEALLPRQTHRSWAWLRQAAVDTMLPHIEAQYREELQGIVDGLAARGVHVSLGDVVLYNAFEELPNYYVPWYNDHHHQAKVAGLVAPGNCSAFIATGEYTKGGQIVMGHNTWTDLYTGERWNIIYDIVPSHGLHILMDGYPGVITSDDDFGINSAGLMIEETTISQFDDYDPNGVPEFVRSRKAMQYAHNINQWIAIMEKGNNGGYANDWLLGDRKTSEIARVELGLKHQAVWRTKNGMYVGANFPSDPAVIKDETTGFDPGNLSESPNARRVRWLQLKREYKGKIDIAVAKKMEADDYDSFEHRIDPDARSLDGHGYLSPRPVQIWGWPPYKPAGTAQAKVTDSAMAARMEFAAAMGSPDGVAFHAAKFFQAHPEFDDQKPYVGDLPSYPWTLFQATGASR